MIIAIDPGINGGIAFYERQDIVHKMVFPMGATESDTYQIINNMVNKKANPHAVIEKVHSMPKQGVSSSFKFGMNYGFLRGIIISLGIPLHEVTPQRWQRGLGIPKRDMSKPQTQHKANIKGVAQQRHPEMKLTLKTCDAVLIADWAWENYPDWR